MESIYTKGQIYELTEIPETRLGDLEDLSMVLMYDPITETRADIRKIIAENYADKIILISTAINPKSQGKTDIFSLTKELKSEILTNIKKKLEEELLPRQVDKLTRESQELTESLNTLNERIGTQTEDEEREELLALAYKYQELLDCYILIEAYTGKSDRYKDEKEAYKSIGERLDETLAKIEAENDENNLVKRKIDTVIKLYEKLDRVLYKTINKLENKNQIEEELLDLEDEYIKFSKTLKDKELGNFEIGKYLQEIKNIRNTIRKETEEMNYETRALKTNLEEILNKITDIKSKVDYYANKENSTDYMYSNDDDYEDTLSEDFEDDDLIPELETEEKEYVDTILAQLDKINTLVDKNLGTNEDMMKEIIEKKIQEKEEQDMFLIDEDVEEEMLKAVETEEYDDDKAILKTIIKNIDNIVDIDVEGKDEITTFTITISPMN